MYHVISLIVVLISFCNRLSAQTYADADCNGDVCFVGLQGSPSIKCSASPTVVTPAPTPANSPYVISPPLTGGEPVWSAIAVNPIDGQIFVLFTEYSSAQSAAVYLGTVEDPYNDTAPFIITPIGSGLATEQYTALTFDCEGNAYGVTSGSSPTITRLDLATGTEISSDAIAATSTCKSNVECRELIMYDYDTDEFIRISTAANDTFNRLYVRSSIEGPDDPINGTLIHYNRVCRPTADIVTATYIGNGIALVYCGGYSDKAAILDMTDINNPILRPESFAMNTTDGIFAYNADGSVCKPPSCTLTPTATTTPSPVMAYYSSDSESDSESGSDSSRFRGGNRNRNRNGNGNGNGSGSGDGAEMFQNAADLGYADENENENEENMSETITVDVSDKTVLHFWALFAVFGVVNIVGCCCIFKRDTKKLKFVTPKPPTIDL